VGVVSTYILILLAGLVQEILITSYHREFQRNHRCAVILLTFFITILSLMVMTEVIRHVLDPALGLLSLLLITIFAAGKGLGAYLSMRWWGN